MGGPGTIAGPSSLSLAEQLRRHRRAAGLSQEALAERAGLSVRAVSDLERGVKAPHRHTLGALADALGLPTGERAAWEAERRRLTLRSEPLRRERSGPGNLPSPVNRLIGRREALATVTARLRQPWVRLVTLTGPGGVGKTRLALAAAAAVRRDFPDGAWLVPLAPLRDPGLVPSAIAVALGVREEPGRSLAEALRAFLRERAVLLLLDNWEHLLAGAPVVSALLAGCPRLKVLATSREPLRLSGEWEIVVSPLALPTPAQAAAPAALARVPAAALFAERARAARADFALTGETARTVAAICARLDGLPLALELAAPWLRVLAPTILLRRLEDRLLALGGGPRDLPERLRTLRGAIAWSHDVLEPALQRLFRRLGVFAGGFTTDAAAAVGDRRELEAMGGVEAALAALAEKSLVQAERTPDGETRYRLLEGIREYALERLEDAAEAEPARRQHRDWYLTLAVRAQPALSGPDQEVWLERLEQEHDNLRAAIQWSAESGEVEVGLRLGGALWRFWAMHGHLREGRERLSALLALPAPGAPSAPRTAARANALRGAGILALEQCDYAAARLVLEESLAIGREVGDRQGIAASLNNLGCVVQHQGDYAAARALLEQSLAIKRELDDRQGIASSLLNLGLTAHLQGDLALARDRLEESLAVFRERRADLNIANGLSGLGYLLLDLSDAGAARSRFQESLVIRRRLRYHAGIAVALEGLAGVAAAQGCPERAMRLAGAAAALRAPIGVPTPPLERDALARWLRFARRALTDDAAAARRAEGQAMTPEQAIAYALEEAREEQAVAPAGSGGSERPPGAAAGV